MLNLSTGPSVVGILEEVEAVPGVGRIYGEAEDFLVAFGGGLASASRATSEAGGAFLDALEACVEAFPGLGNEDYDPPQYDEDGYGLDSSDGDDNDAVGDDDEVGGDVNGAVNAHGEESNAFVESHATALDAFAELAAYQSCGGGGNAASASENGNDDVQYNDDNDDHDQDSSSSSSSTARPRPVRCPATQLW